MAHLGQEVNKGPDDLRRGLSYDRGGLACAGDPVMARVRGSSRLKSRSLTPQKARGFGMTNGWDGAVRAGSRSAAHVTSAQAAATATSVRVAATAALDALRAGARVIKTEEQIPHPAKGAG